MSSSAAGSVRWSLACVLGDEARASDLEDTLEHVAHQTDRRARRASVATLEPPDLLAAHRVLATLRDPMTVPAVRAGLVELEAWENRLARAQRVVERARRSKPPGPPNDPSEPGPRAPRPRSLASRPVPDEELDVDWTDSASRDRLIDQTEAYLTEWWLIGRQAVEDLERAIAAECALVREELALHTLASRDPRMWDARTRAVPALRRHETRRLLLTEAERARRDRQDEHARLRLSMDRVRADELPEELEGRADSRRLNQLRLFQMRDVAADYDRLVGTAEGEW